MELEQLREENDLLKRQIKAALHLTTMSTIEHLMWYDEYLAARTNLPYREWREQFSPGVM